jgi:hypothetical protein
MSRRFFATSDVFAQTYIGPMIISVNPFQSLPLYGQDKLQDYQTKPLDTLPPHPFAVAQKAWKALTSGSSSQSVIISGESGNLAPKFFSVGLSRVDCPCFGPSSIYPLLILFVTSFRLFFCFRLGLIARPPQLEPSLPSPLLSSRITSRALTSSRSSVFPFFLTIIRCRKNGSH